MPLRMSISVPFDAVSDRRRWPYAPNPRQSSASAARMNLVRRVILKEDSPVPCGRHNERVISVLIADDQELVRTGFRVILEAEGDIEVIAEAENGNEAVRRAALAKPDVVLMDIRMPELDG